MGTFLMLSLATKAQRVAIGQQAPNWTSHEVLNYKNSTISFSDFKGKHIILDFWNHSCLSCVKAFPQIDSMQKRFDGQLQIILVNAESKDSTLRFFKKHPKIKMPSTPIIAGAHDLWMLFTESKTPYQLWLDVNRTVQYRTGPYNLTPKHLEAFLKDQKLDILNTGEGNDRAYDDDLSADANYYSLLTHCRPGLNMGNTSGTVVDEKETITISSNCVSVVELYLKAYSEYDKYAFNVPSQIVLDVIDKSPYIFPEDEDEWDEWKTTYAYSYQLRLPAAKKNVRYTYMQQDLDRCFGLKVKIEKRKLPCLALIKTASLDKIRSKGGKTKSTMIGRKYENDSVRYVQNYSFKNFSAILRGLVEWNTKLPFVDKTGCSFNIDLRLKAASLDPLDREGLNKELSKYNLKVITSREWIDVLVLKK
ncbi:MAG: TlpA family protein disulfide reductase [Flavisolibacter sp.]